VNSIDEENDYFDTSIKLRKLKRKDEGTYVCEVINVFNRTHEIKLNILSEPRNIKITMTNKEVHKNMTSEVKNNETFTVRYYEDIELNCTVYGNPTPKITFFKNGFEIAKNFIKLDKEQLNSHAGKYKCSGNNSFGSVQQEFELKVEITPFVNSDKKKTFGVKKGENVTLNCDLIGIPEPEIAWKLNSANFNFQNKIYTFESNVNTSGKYECFGKNAFGVISNSFEVLMKGKGNVK
jgi:hypothetical protein